VILSCGQLQAQPNFDWGIGLSYNLHYFQHKDPDRFANQLYQPKLSHLPGLNLYFDFNKNRRFQLRANLGIGEKRIALANRFFLNQTGLKVTSAINHRIGFADVGMVAVLNFIQKNINCIQPIIGFFVSFNQYLDLYRSVKIGGGTGGINENSTPALDLTVSNYPFFVYAGIKLGANYPFLLKDRKFEFYSMINYSPAKLFGLDLTYQTNSQQQNISGSYHYLSTGINMSLQKQIKN